MTLDPLVAALRLGAGRQPAPRALREAWATHGSLDALLGADAATLPEGGARLLERLHRAVRDEDATVAAWRTAGGVVSVFAPDYPAPLRRLPDPPLAIFWRGADPRRWTAPRIVLVGTRTPTGYGAAVAERLSGELAAAGAAVGSGLARGIDAAAHRGAVAVGGLSFACVGTGLDRVHPVGHRELSEAMIDAGGTVLGEYAPGAAVRPHHFVARNRLLAACADAVVVVEGGAKSGALITADFALDLGTEVLAVPGRLGDAMAAAPLKLLRQGAAPACDAAQILAAAGAAPGVTAAARPSGPAEPGLERLFQALPEHTACHVDDLAAELGQPVAAVLAELLSLELGGWVKALPGKHYVRATPGEVH